ncbi:MAG: rod-binding protein [Planctomycetaceae bacterium]
MIQSTQPSDWSRALPMANPAMPTPSDPAEAFAKSLAGEASSVSGEEPLREAFRDFVGQTMFGQMLQSMRSTVGKPAYFHGGRGEEVFQQQLDQLLVEELSESSASSVADPMFDLFQLQRGQ